MKKVAGRLRIDLAQYRALEAFAQLGSELDKASQQQLTRGARVVEILKQPQYAPVTPAHQVVHVWTATAGHLDDLPIEDARRFVEEFTAYVENRHADAIASLAEGTFGDDVEQTLSGAVEEFSSLFAPSSSTDEASEAALGQGSARDDVKPDVGWDRMSSEDDEDGSEDGET